MYEAKTYDAVLTDLLSRVPDTVDKREGSVIYDALAPCAAEIASFYAALDEIITETYVDTASLEGLILRAKERGIEYCAVVSRWGKANGFKEWRYVFIPSKQIQPYSTFAQLAERFAVE